MLYYAILYLHNVLLLYIEFFILLLFYTISINILRFVCFQPSSDSDSKNRWFGQILMPCLIIMRGKLCFEEENFQYHCWGSSIPVCVGLTGSLEVFRRTWVSKDETLKPDFLQAMENYILNVDNP